MLIYCVLVCLLLPSKKSFAPHLSLSLLVGESQLCVSVFFSKASDVNDETAECIWSFTLIGKKDDGWD